MSEVERVALIKRWRGMILELVYNGHRRQESRMDALMLWGLMQDLRQDVGRNDVITEVQALGDMGYLHFNQSKNEWTNEVEITQIAITASGRGLVERTAKPDPAVRLR